MKVIKEYHEQRDGKKSVFICPTCGSRIEVSDDEIKCGNSVYEYDYFFCPVCKHRCEIGAFRYLMGRIRHYFYMVRGKV